MSMSARLMRIRKEERKYHEHTYDVHKLYKKGSWLHEPTEAVMEAFWEIGTGGGPLSILDLGCGVGRNSIPLAEKVRDKAGRVVCVDLLDKAIQKLREYGRRYGVGDTLAAEQSDISDFRFPPESFDYIVAASSLEHVRTEKMLEEVLGRMAEGTKSGGVNCIVMHTSIEEYDERDGSRRETLFEVVLDRDKALDKLRRAYAGWEELRVSDEPTEFPINRGDVPVRLKAVSVTFAVRKS